MDEKLKMKLKSKKVDKAKEETIRNIGSSINKFSAKFEEELACEDTELPIMARLEVASVQARQDCDRQVRTLISQVFDSIDEEEEIQSKKENT